MCRPTCVGLLTASGACKRGDEVEAGLPRKDAFSQILMPFPRRGLVRLCHDDTVAEVIEVHSDLEGGPLPNLLRHLMNL